MDPKESIREWQKTPTHASAGDSTREIRVPAHHPALVVLVGSVAGKSYPLAEEIVIGRGPEADLQIASSDVSRRHARIWRDPARGYLIEDLGSCNGTLVDGVPAARAQPLRYGNRIQLGTSAVLMLTHHSPLEDRLVEQQKLEAVGRLASGVSEEYGRLLTLMRDDLRRISQDAANRTLGPSELRDRFAPLEAKLDEAIALTEQLRAFACPQAAPTLEVDLGAVLTSVVRLVRHGGEGIEFKVQLEPDLIIAGDPLQLQQVFMALCQHAKESVAAVGGGEVTVSARLLPLEAAAPTTADHPNETRQVLVAIADNGPGLDPQTREQLFEPFTSSRTARGGRPGLAAAYALVRNHNGHLEVDSEPGQGTVLRVYLPETDEGNAAPTIKALPAVAAELLRQRS